MEDKQSKMEVEDYLRYTLFMLHKTIVYGIKKKPITSLSMVSKKYLFTFFYIFLNIWLIEKKDQPAYEISLVHLLIYFCVASLEASCT